MGAMIPTEDDWYCLLTAWDDFVRGDFPHSIRRLRMLIKGGGRRLAEAVALLAMLRERGASIPPGLGGESDLWREALRGYSARALTKDPGALYALGWCAAMGKGVRANRRTAFRRWLRAAQEGHIHAQHLVGRLLETGRDGIPPDEGQAVLWLTKAARRGLRVSQNRLSRLLARGARDWKSERMARYWSMRARAPHGYAEELQHCRRLLESGGQPGARPRALRLLRGMAERHSDSARKAVGMLVEMYQAGDARPRDIQEAYSWYSKAACSGESAPELRRALRREVCRFAQAAVPPNSRHRVVYELISVDWNGVSPQTLAVARLLLRLDAAQGWNAPDWAVRAVAGELATLSDVAFDFPLELEGDLWRRQMIGGPLRRSEWGIFSAIAKGLELPLKSLRAGIEEAASGAAVGFASAGEFLEAARAEFLGYIIDRFHRGDRQYRSVEQLLTWELFARGERGDRWPREEDEG